MSMTDPIADLLTRIRNAQSAGKPSVGMGASKLKVAILKVLKTEGYIADFGVDNSGAKSTLSIELKYHDGRPVIDRIERISRPGLRIYRAKDEVPKVLGALGVGGEAVTVKGAKGSLTLAIKSGIKVVQQDKHLEVEANTSVEGMNAIAGA